MKAMIFAAGLGTRLRPLTNDRPKALVEIAPNTTLLHYNINYLKQFGVDTVIVNIHHFADKVIQEIQKHNNFGINIILSDEQDQLLETGGGLLKAAPHFSSNEDFIVYNVDVVSNIDLHQMLHYHQEEQALATLATRQRETSRYLLFNEKNELCGWQNTKTDVTKIVRPHQQRHALAFSGIHIINSQLLSLIKQKGKFSITNTYLKLARQHKIVSYPHDQDYWFDVGKPHRLSNARHFLQENNS